jgi:hypothetical protein
MSKHQPALRTITALSALCLCFFIFILPDFFLNSIDIDSTREAQPHAERWGEENQSDSHTYPDDITSPKALHHHVPELILPHAQAGSLFTISRSPSPLLPPPKVI